VYLVGLLKTSQPSSMAAGLMCNPQSLLSCLNDNHREHSHFACEYLLARTDIELARTDIELAGGFVVYT
jgi:hypothetical protein